MTRAGNERTGYALLNIPVAEQTVISEATMVAINEDGYAVPASKSEGLIVAGCAEMLTDNSVGLAGAVTTPVKRGAFVWNNDGTISTTDLLKTCYVKDATTVTLTADGSSPAGTIIEVDGDGVTVDMINAAANSSEEQEGE